MALNLGMGTPVAEPKSVAVPPTGGGTKYTNFVSLWREYIEPKFKQLVANWRKTHKPNPPGSEGGDSWHVNDAMWDDRFIDEFYNTCLSAWQAGQDGTAFDDSQGNSYYDKDLDGLVKEVYEYGKQNPITPDPDARVEDEGY